jgi:dipeptidyl aminopeptidase/acylaminoacyl peptidase
MQDDMHDALQWAITQGLVDKNKVCIMGASYGGYAALMGPGALPRGLPLRDQLGGAHRPAPNGARLRQRVGRERSLDALKLKPHRLRKRTLRQTSPLHAWPHWRSCGVPVLAAWGVDDQRVPIAHGRHFRDAARRPRWNWSTWNTRPKAMCG